MDTHAETHRSLEDFGIDYATGSSADHLSGEFGPGVAPKILYLFDGFLLGLLSISSVLTFRSHVLGHEMMVAGLGSSFVFLVRARRRGLYQAAPISDGQWRIGRTGLELLVAAAACTAILLLLSWPVRFAVPTAGGWFAAGGGLLLIERAIFHAVVGHRHLAERLSRHVAIVGDSRFAEQAGRALSGHADLRIVGRFDSDLEALHDDPELNPGGESLDTIGRRGRLDAIVVALPYEERGAVAGLCLRLRTVLSDVYVAPYLLDGFDTALPETKLGRLHLLVARRRPLTEWQSLQKAVFDRSVGLVILLALSPLLLLIAGLIRADSPGPVIFRQPRLGLNNRAFTVLKFRTMHAAQSDLMADRQTARDDPRVTRVGRVLRKLSLDELPQLLNVMAGDMSLVGPRPHAPNTRAGGQLLGDALAEYVIRHQIKPGITGWAQVNGARGELRTVEQLRTRVALDLEYMRRWSLRFDVKVLTLTVVREIFSRHAY